MKRILLLTFLLILNSCEEKPKAIKKEINIKVVNPIDSVKFKSVKIIDSSLIVIDTISNLTWMKNDFSIIKSRFLNDWNETSIWEKEINSSNYAGYSDWRIPTIKEYRTLNKNRNDRKRYLIKFNSIDSISVWGSGPYAFWSKTTPNKETASYISFIDGFATSGNRAKQFSSKYSSWKGVELGMSVRLVRTKE